MTAALPRLTLVLGGARSGKSTYGEKLIRSLPPPWTYIATAEAWDDEMRARIAAHQDQRGVDWQLVEAPLSLTADLARLGAGTQPILVDCLTLWLSNVMLAERDVEAETKALIEALQVTTAPIVVVSNEVGLSIVPDNALARRFRDAQGWLNQDVAAIADHVVFMAAGLPLVLKPAP